MGWNHNRCGMLIIAYLIRTKGGAVTIVTITVTTMSKKIISPIQTITKTTIKLLSKPINNNNINQN